MKTITKDHIHFDFNASYEPADTIVSGETVCFKTLDCYTEQIDKDGKNFEELDMNRNNPITGPLYVEDAQPGDALKVEILDIIPEDHGVMCVRLGKGIYEVEGCHCRLFSIENGTIHFDNGIDIPVKSMVGVLGTCPEKPAVTQVPGEHGGNLDIKDLGIGSAIYLPVYVPGALLSMGDCHGVMGDGETAICGMEMCASVIVRVTLIKGGTDLPTPFIENDDFVYTTSCDESLDVAHVAAARKMHKYLMQRNGLTDAQAAMLLSLVGNLRISQVVNPEKGCIMEFPKKYLK